MRYTTPSALRGLNVSMRLDRLGVAVVTTSDARRLRARPGIAWVRPTVSRRRLGGAVTSTSESTAEWQYAATRANDVPRWVLRAASAITIAVVDTGADVTAPNIAAKRPLTFSTVTGGNTVTDTIGHGTFVASLAGGSDAGGSGFRGFGGNARLMVVQANSSENDFTDANEAEAIVWAVDHGARIINLSLGGPDTSQLEQDALAYAAAHDVLVVAAAGNNGEYSKAPVYPAALLGSNGVAVGASTDTGIRAPFSSPASYVSLLAPGVQVLGAMSSTAPMSAYRRAGGSGGEYGYGTGTSYAAPQVAGAAALVWGVNPSLTATQVAALLERTAGPSGVLDVAAAVAAVEADAVPAAQPRPKPAKVQPSKKLLVRFALLR